MEFETELKKMGLTDKEAAVYVSCLMVGSSPVQQIARKAKVVRATTYVILDSLMQKGLVTTFKKGKKTLFSPEPPNQLMRLLEKQREDLKEKEEELEALLPELQMLMKAGDGKPSGRYFEGKEGLHAIRQEIVMYTKPGEMVYNFTPTDYLNSVFPDDEDEQSYYKPRIAKGIRSRTLFTTQSEKLKKRMLEQSRSRLAEMRFIPHDLYPVSSGMTIYGNRIAIGSFTGKLMGVVIEGEEMASMMRSFFDLAWRGAEVLARTDK
jgi:sugar-specific transcriptional regulator TrmB